MKITVLSDGGWGTALAVNLLSNGNQVTLWGAFPDYLDEMRKTRKNRKFLPGVSLPEDLKFEPDMKAAASGAGIIVLAAPTQYLRGVLNRLDGILDREHQLLVNVAKGIEINTWMCIREMCRDVLGKDIRYTALSGPSHAEEVSRGVPTAVVAASHNLTDAELVQKVFMNSRFRVYSSDDPVGVELGGALKNVMAVGAGIIDGMKLGDNPKAAMMTRAVSEMGRLGKQYGGKPETFSGLSGIGDLIVTCCSGHSRNRHVGEELGKGRLLNDILKEMGMVVAEGVYTAKGAKVLAERAGIDTPIINEIYAVLYENRPVPESLSNLMGRSAKSER